MFVIELKYHIKHLNESRNPNGVSPSSPKLDIRWISLKRMLKNNTELRVSAIQCCGSTLNSKMSSKIHNAHVRQTCSVCHSSMILRRVFCFSCAAPSIWNWTSAWKWMWMVWFSLVDDMNGSQWVVGREHKRVFNSKSIVLLSIAFLRINSELSAIFIFSSFRFYVLSKRMRDG